MKLGVHKGRKVTEPDFLEKFSFGPNLGIWAQNGPKTGFLRGFGLSRKIESLLLAGNVNEVFCCYLTSRENPMSGKSLVLEKKGKSGRSSWLIGPKMHYF